MNKAGALLAARIISELKELSVLAKRAEQGLKKAKEKNDDYYLDSVALNLHSLYSGLERIFERIATAIDSSLPLVPTGIGNCSIKWPLRFLVFARQSYRLI